MTYPHIRRCFLIFSLLLAAQSVATEQRGLLWEITAPDHATSYLFGTIHSEDERVLALPAQVEVALRASPRFVMELVPDERVTAQLGRRMQLPAGERLDALLEPALHRQLQAVLARHGLPAEAAERLKPWALVMILTMPRPRSGLFLDQLLHDMALSEGKVVTGIETVDEQIAALDGLDMAQQLELLRHTLDHYEEIDDFTEALIATWLARDLDALQRLGEASNAGLPAALEQTLQARLVDERNVRMVQRLLPLLQQDGVFVAVGALHLPGEQGIIALLRQRGFSVRPLY